MRILRFNTIAIFVHFGCRRCVTQLRRVWCSYCCRHRRLHLLLLLHFLLLLAVPTNRYSIDVEKSPEKQKCRYILLHDRAIYNVFWWLTLWCLFHPWLRRLARHPNPSFSSISLLSLCFDCCAKSLKLVQLKHNLLLATGPTCNENIARPKNQLIQLKLTTKFVMQVKIACEMLLIFNWLADRYSKKVLLSAALQHSTACSIQCLHNWFLSLTNLRHQSKMLIKLSPNEWVQRNRCNRLQHRQWRPFENIL